MASANPISASCQSIASTGNPSNALGAGSLRNTSTQYINGTGSLGRIKFHYHKSLEGSDEELDISQLSHSTHVLERVKSERFLASKPDEDRRRRTIIVEKKNGSYGFTLQSYGIHYKKEQEVEMITYVDYVEYDGPAYRSGMREGDVILAINGADMEKADHKTLVDFIKSCDARMRMVVLFEDCVRKVDLHMRYIQLQNVLQSKMNEMERICLRERELLEGKWKTHSLPARKKTTTSPTDAEAAGLSPSDLDLTSATYYRPALSTEDVTNITRHQSQQTIIPPPTQYMLTYHYLNPSYRYVLKPTNSSGKYLVAVGDGTHHPTNEQQYILTRAASMETDTMTAETAHQFIQQQQLRNASGQPPVPPPRTCEKHKPPINQQQQQPLQQHLHQTETTSNATPQKSHKSGRHCHEHSCNPCIGNFRWKSADKAAAATPVGNGDNVSLDAYDLASPCCDTHCVPTRRRNRHHKEHTHKHKHRDRERETKERAPRPKSQSQASPSTAGRHAHHHHHDGAEVPQQQQLQQPQHHHHHHHHQHQQRQQNPAQQQHSCDSKTGSMRSRYLDLTAGLASHCSLHSCTSSELAHGDSTSYTTSLSTDTLYWDQQSDNAASRQHSTKSRQSYGPQQQPTQQQSAQPHTHGVYQQRYQITATQIQPSQIYPNATAYAQKPKSWDNLTTKTVGGYGLGYGYLDTVAMKPPIKLHIAQQRHSMPRKNHYGRYSTYTDVENYAPPPSQFVEELTTTTTMITTKSTEDLITVPLPAQMPCDCAGNQLLMPQQQPHAPMTSTHNQYQGTPGTKYYQHQHNCHVGYYSHLPRPTIDAGTSTSTATNNSADVATVSEVTRL